jgi:Zn-dependent oligopeptidase
MNFQLSADQIDALTASIVKTHTKAMDNLVEQEATFAAFAHAEAEAVIKSSQVTLPALTHTDAAAREASSKAKQVLKQMWDRTYAREDLYTKLKAVADTIAFSAKGEDLRFVQRTLEAFEQNGVGSASGEQYGQLNEECGKKTARYEQNINEDTSTILLSRTELNGCKDTLFESLPVKAVDGKVDANLFEVSMKVPSRIPVLEYAQSAETRKRVSAVANARCQTENRPLLSEILKLRMEKSKLLGYDTHAAYMLKQKMVGTLEDAKAFLQDIHTKLKPLRAEETELLLAKKRAEQASSGNNGGDSVRLNSWDMSYYSRMAKEDMQIDSEKVREFFPLEHVKSAIFAVYQDLLGVQFEKLSGKEGTAAAATATPVWHEEVELYEVRDVATSEVCGHIFLDLFSRDGKFGHQCVVPIVPSCRVKQAVVPPACAILGNMTKPTKTRPSLLRFAEVHTFFHEFGHVIQIYIYIYISSFLPSPPPLSSFLQGNACRPRQG